ncbi:hypothetical protein BS47DRAFT_598802 [Hydnum rufescens UP504]|uniref:Uncharacterized protein n=1 Tax=Hydnum rufescens UP504 TaxID=1448309 RepID=A0A9P6AFG4_9AGAM|nr:hypothetical protein BS47DRAFT_598802 [Hydnum rufescens UP504]
MYDEHHKRSNTPFRHHIYLFVWPPLYESHPIWGRFKSPIRPHPSCPDLPEKKQCRKTGRRGGTHRLRGFTIEFIQSLDYPLPFVCSIPIAFSFCWRSQTRSLQGFKPIHRTEMSIFPAVLYHNGRLPLTCYSQFHVPTLILWPLSRSRGITKFSLC